MSVGGVAPMFLTARISTPPEENWEKRLVHSENNNSWSKTKCTATVFSFVDGREYFINDYKMHRKVKLLTVVSGSALIAAT